MERTYFFSDAVFAIAITLLALDIKVPKASTQAIGAELPSLVLAQWQDMLSFFISFLIIGAYWMAHHRMFHYIKRYDATLLWLNLVFLMSIAFLPFPDKVLSELGDRSSPQRDVYRFVPWTGVKYPGVPGNTERRQPGETVFRG